MNILYVDEEYRLRDNYMYRYYGDLYRELNKKANIRILKKMPKDYSIINNSNFDCVIFGLGYFTNNNPSYYAKLRGLDKVNVPVVCLLHKPQTMLEEKLMFCKINKIDLLLDTNITYKEFAKAIGCKGMRLWFTADPDIYYPRDVPKSYDFGFSGADHGGDKIKGPTNNLRNRVHECLSQEKYNIFWNSTRDLSYRIQSVEEYATKINECKIWLATTGPNNDVSPRYFEVMLSKTLLLCNNMPYEYEGLFIDGVNCVLFENDLSDLNEKVKYYLENNEEREAIINRAYDMGINKYTWEHMASMLLNEIKEIECPSK